MESSQSDMPYGILVDISAIFFQEDIGQPWGYYQTTQTNKETTRTVTAKHQMSDTAVKEKLQDSHKSPGAPFGGNNRAGTQKKEVDNLYPNSLNTSQTKGQNKS